MSWEQRLTGLGWHETVPPNGHAARPPLVSGQSNSNPLGLDTPMGDVVLETTPEHRNLSAGDPACAGWVRRHDDPNVVAFREYLRTHNGIRGLEVVEPTDVERAARLLHRDGFVAVRDVVPPDHLERLRDAAATVIEQLVAVDRDCSAGGGAGGLPHRYSFGGSSASRHMLHLRPWIDLIDLPTTTPILTAIFGSSGYLVGGGGGDIAMPGAIEYQGLHSDSTWSELHDPVGGTTMRDVPPPIITVNFPLSDLTWENGPIRQIPGTQRSRAPIPNLADEPAWMKLSTVCPLPAGSAIFRDVRAWHGGTPNLSHDVRAMPNIEYLAPWFRNDVMQTSMPYDEWVTLSPHARRISRMIAGRRHEVVVGAGFVHPRAAEREALVERQLASMSPEEADEFRSRR